MLSTNSWEVPQIMLLSSRLLQLTSSLRSCSSHKEVSTFLSAGIWSSDIAGTTLSFHNSRNLSMKKPQSVLQIRNKLRMIIYMNLKIRTVIHYCTKENKVVTHLFALAQECTSTQSHQSVYMNLHN